ncbi:unnamed protein product [Clavelina lepadiformis]|uniref:Peptidase M14 domain-containing protein n=1 Tax=Clavelina lepadiformis TaxID=159417 RepID=A0ABP0GH91_CLALP
MKFLIILSLAALALAKVRFDGHQVLSLYPTTREHIDLIKEFGSYDGFADFWSPDSADLAHIDQKIDVRFRKESLRIVKKKLEAAGMSFEVKIADMQPLIDSQFDVPRKNKALFGYDYDVYHTYDEIVQWANDVANQYPLLAKYEKFGDSYEGREIPRLTLGTSASNPIVLIDCGIHAREWISPAFCQCYVNRMLSQYGVDTGVTAAMQSLTFVVLPVLNADGYAYSHTDDRMWRKTRRDNGGFCKGVDPNRNFDANWAGPGSSASPCSETYYGPSVASEPLTQALQNFVLSNKGNIKAYITFHSYGQVFIYPYSYAVQDAPNKAELDAVAANSAAAIESVNRKAYTYGPGYESMYLAAGGSDDFSLDQGATLSYTIELRDTGRYGFLLPESQIADSCTETYEGMDVITDYVRNSLI